MKVARITWEDGDSCYVFHDKCVDCLDDVPPAEPEIIRCKDCRFWKTYTYINGKPRFLPKCGFNQIYVNGEDFCSRAERREK